MAKVLKFWHQWNWAIHVCVWLVMGTLWLATYQNAIANNSHEIEFIKAQRIPERMATQEQITKDINDQLTRIENVQSKTFERINQLADRGK